MYSVELLKSSPYSRKDTLVLETWPRAGLTECEARFEVTHLGMQDSSSGFEEDWPVLNGTVLYSTVGRRHDLATRP